jgi:hypothetical protein
MAKYVIRVDGLLEGAAEYLAEFDDPDVRTTDKKRRATFEDVEHARTMRDAIIGTCGFEAARLVKLVPKREVR